MSSFGYFISEGFRGLRENLGVSIGTVITVFLSLSVIGLFFFGSAVVDEVASEIESQVSITAYISDDASKADVDRAKSDLSALDHVVFVSYTSKDQALENFKGSVSYDSSVANSIGKDNPLPASFIIELDEPRQVPDVAAKIAALPAYIAVSDTQSSPAASVVYGRQTVERMFAFTSLARTAVLAIAALLSIVAFVFMVNDIRLSIMNRRKDIYVEKLVGASNSFVKGPFVMEGAICALIGAIFAIAILEIGHAIAIPLASQYLAWLPLDTTTFFRVSVYAALAASALVVCVIGSSIAAKRYLR